MSFLETPPSVAGIGAFKAESELACARRCCSQKECTEAVFFNVARRCSLYNAKEKVLEKFKEDSEGAKPEYVRIKKVNISGTMQGGGFYDIAAGGNTKSVDLPLPSDITDKNTNWSSCGEILRHNSSNTSGYYNLTNGNFTWRTHCMMKGISTCGGGAWTLVMRVNGSQDTFRYNSTEWSKTATANKRRETKLLGYWLSPFNKICVQLRFPQFNDTKTALVLNHAAPSLHSVLLQGGNLSKTEAVSSITEDPWTPNTPGSSCLEKGLNMIVSNNITTIKLRIGVVSQATLCPPPSPVFARGVGFDWLMRFPDNITCGEIYSDHSGPRVFPAFCRIYIQ
ncbi:hypothetical protein ACROYT_G008951 [Oculina patagonica]